MADKPQPFYKTNLRHHRYGGSSNRLFDAANPFTAKGVRRERAPRTDTDTRGNLNDFGWRELLSAARYLYGNFGPIRGAMWQMVNYAVGNAFQVQYIGADKAWGAKMEEAVYESDKICDVRGNAYDFKTGLCLDLLSIIRDGDCNTILTQTEAGWPQFQSVPSHRIASVGMIEDGKILDGPFAGREICNGVILSDYGRPVGYRIAMGQDSHVDIAAGTLAQDYRPEFYDQARGITWLAAAIYDVQDIADIRRYLKTALKAEASITLVEHNEAGEPMDIGSSILLGSATRNGDNTLTSTPSVEMFDDSTIRYFRANTQSKIEAPNTQRPSTNAQAFNFEILRGAFEALGWPIEFYDPSALGGANIRMRVAQARRTLDAIQHIARRIATRKHTYVIAKLIKLGVLEPAADWWKIEHKAPRDLTVDNGRDTKADLELYLKGVKSLDQLCAADGNYWEEVQDQKITEAKRLKERCAAEGVDPSWVQMLTPNGNQNQEASNEKAE